MSYCSNRFYGEFKPKNKNKNQGNGGNFVTELEVGHRKMRSVQ